MNFTLTRTVYNICLITKFALTKSNVNQKYVSFILGINLIADELNCQWNYPIIYYEEVFLSNYANYECLEWTLAGSKYLSMELS